MNEKILEMIQGEESAYPHELEAHYARVMNKIIELWGTHRIEEYFLDLMVDKRGDRQGFPPKVVADIFRLSQIHERTHGTLKPVSQDPWTKMAVRELMESAPQYAYTPLEFLKAVEMGNSATIGRFLSRGTNLEVRDERGWSPLMIAAANGNEEIAALLLRSGADVRATDNAGYTPLHWAAFNGHDKVVKLLIEQGSDPNALSNFGWSSLMQAATRGHCAAAELLIKGGADVNLSNTEGWTALLKATANGHVRMVMLLLAMGADPNLRHQDGSTALSIASKGKNETLIATLQRAAR
ncbi:MAG: ankyrin repeat domain-containing protein [Nitrosomonadales bacterium]|nr:ankyrin repeat domain-containing protein [Nitrosomonadales bacterium]